MATACATSAACSIFSAFFPGCAVTGLLLAWRFNSSRVLFSLLTLLLAHRAVAFFSAGQVYAGQAYSGPGRMAVALAALLIPLNFMVFASMRERGLVVAGVAPRCGLLFLESVVFAVLSRPENSPASPYRPGAAAIPLWILLSFVYPRSAPAERVATAVPDHHGSHGIHGSVLDSTVSDLRRGRPRGMPGQRPACQARSGAQERCDRLPMAAVSPLGRAAAGLVSTGGIGFA